MIWERKTLLFFFSLKTSYILFSTLTLLEFQSKMNKQYFYFFNKKQKNFPRAKRNFLGYFSSKIFRKLVDEASGRSHKNEKKNHQQKIYFWREKCRKRIFILSKIFLKISFPKKIEFLFLENFFPTYPKILFASS